MSSAPLILTDGGLALSEPKAVGAQGSTKIHNPSPFVQTHGSFGLSRQTIAHGPANFVG